MKKPIKERELLRFVPTWRENRSRREREQIKVFYRPMTLGEFESYASNRETQIERIFKNHVSFENLVEPKTNRNIESGGDFMDSTFAGFRPLLTEIAGWIFFSSVIDGEEEKN